MEYDVEKQNIFNNDSKVFEINDHVSMEKLPSCMSAKQLQGASNNKQCSKNKLTKSKFDPQMSLDN